MCVHAHGFHAPSFGKILLSLEIHLGGRFWLTQVYVGDYSYLETELRLEAKGKRHFRSHQI